MTRLIKRYGNRKMYDTQASRYVTLDDVAELVRGGGELRIIDNDTGEDLTAVTFAQIILEEAKRDRGSAGLPILRRLIEQGAEAFQEFWDSVDRSVDRGREALESVREFAEKGVKQLVGPGDRRRRGKGGGQSRLEAMLQVPQRQIEQLQRRIDKQLRAALKRFTKYPLVQTELKRLQESVRGIERQLLRVGRPAPPARPKRRRAKAAQASVAKGGAPKAGTANVGAAVPSGARPGPRRPGPAHPGTGRPGAGRRTRRS